MIAVKNISVYPCIKSVYKILVYILTVHPNSLFLKLINPIPLNPSIQFRFSLDLASN